MHNRLFFVCPTDHLESEINSRLNQKNFFWTSLANSIRFEADLVGEIISLVETNNITSICFVLSDSNQLIHDALSTKDFSYLNGLGEFYDIITEQKSQSKPIWKEHTLLLPILSLYLNLKKEELEYLLSGRLDDRVEIETRIYNREKGQFHRTCTTLFHRGNYCLN